jgi:hypothetical protein
VNLARASHENDRSTTQHPGKSTKPHLGVPDHFEPDAAGWWPVYAWST